MNVIDGVILLVLVMGLVRGLMAGAVKTTISLVGWLLALVLASKFAPILALFLQPMIDNRVWQITLAFFIIAFVLVIIAHVVAWLIIKTLTLLKLGLLDRLLGGVLGVAKSTLKVLIIMSMTAPILAHVSSAKSSVLVQSLLPFAPVAKEVVGEIFEQTWQEVENPYQSL